MFGGTETYDILRDGAEETWPSRDNKTYCFPEVKVNKRFVT